MSMESDYRPRGWKLPRKLRHDSDMILTRGFPDGHHEIVRVGPFMEVKDLELRERLQIVSRGLDEVIEWPITTGEVARIVQGYRGWETNVLAGKIRRYTWLGMVEAIRPQGEYGYRFGKEQALAVACLVIVKQMSDWPDLYGFPFAKKRISDKELAIRARDLLGDSGIIALIHEPKKATSSSKKKKEELGELRRLIDSSGQFNNLV